MPLATSSIAGVVKVSTGLKVDAAGALSVNGATNNAIDSKNSSANPVTTLRIDRAVRAGLISNSEITAADLPAIHKTLGVEKEWVLKGVCTTETVNSMISIDMSDCTEMFISGYLYSDENVRLFAFVGNGVGLIEFDEVSDETSGFFCIYMKDTGMFTGPIFALKGANAAIMSHNVKAPGFVGALKDITWIRFLHNVDKFHGCNVKIYAR